MVKYVPILKWKYGEYSAVSHLTKEVAQHIAPLFEVTPPDFDFEKWTLKKTIDAQLKDFSKKYKKYCASTTSFVDTHLLDPSENLKDGRCPIAFIFDELREENLSAIPVFGIENENDKVQYAVKNINKTDKRGVCLRLKLKDIMRKDLEKKIEINLSQISCNVKNVDLIIDLEKPSSFDPIEDFTDAVCSYINRLPYLKDWRSFILSATSFPKSMAEISGTEGIKSRDEWIVYNKLLESSKIKGRMPLFSDYAIGIPGCQVLNFRVIDSKNSIKYAVDENWFILKGTKRKKEKGYGKEFHFLSEKLVNSKYYLGKNFSWGDKFIDRVAKEREKAETGDVTNPGNKTSWVGVGVNHHITKVVEDISNIVVS